EIVAIGGVVGFGEVEHGVGFGGGVGFAELSLEGGVVVVNLYRGGGIGGGRRGRVIHGNGFEPGVGGDVVAGVAELFRLRQRGGGGGAALGGLDLLADVGAGHQVVEFLFRFGFAGHGGNGREDR